MSSLCIGCGCDEQRACTIAGRHACWWLRFDNEARVGICSRCDDLVEAWDAGERALQLGSIADRFYRQAMPAYQDMLLAMAWIEAPQPLLGNRSPRALILEGKLTEVRAVLDQILDDVHL